MSVATPVRETREVLIARAKEAMRLAELEPVRNRARIHLQAAETWLRLASRKVVVEAAGSSSANDQDPAIPDESAASTTTLC